MKVEIISPEEKVFEGEAISATFPGSKGMFQILNGHAPIISSLDPGTVTLKTESGDQHFEVKGGVVEVVQDKVIVLV